MRIRYHQLVGKQVITADGKRVGSIADLVADPIDGRLYVTALLVGRMALFRRIAFRETVLRISWELVARIGDRVELRVTSRELRELGRGLG